MNGKNKQELTKAVEDYKTEVKGALETVINSLNKGQRKKIIAVPEVAKLIEIYKVEVAE